MQKTKCNEKKKKKNAIEIQKRFVAHLKYKEI